MKKGLFLVLLLLIPVAAAQGAERDTLSVEFHAINGGETVTLDLKLYFGDAGRLVSNQPEHVEVIIDPDTKVATLKARDQDWRGIETVIFAVSEEFLVQEEKKPTTFYLPRQRKLVIVNFTEEYISSSVTEPFTQEQILALAEQLDVEAVNISASRSERGVMLALNDQVLMNITFERASPSIDLAFDVGEKNRKAAAYQEPNEILMYLFALLGFVGISVLALFVYHAYSVHVAEFLKKREVIVEKFPDDFFLQRKEAQKRVAQLKRKVGEEKAGKLYKEVIDTMYQFFVHGLNAHGNDYGKIEKHLQHLGVKGNTISKIIELDREHKERLYAKEEIRDKDVSNLVSIAESILENI